MSSIETSMNQMVSLRDRGFKYIRQSVQNPETRWIILFIVLGCLLRLVWAEDMKWKEDEIWMYRTARAVVEGRTPWPWLGMSNGVGFLNPGLSVWCFIALAWVSENPVTMVRWVMVSNIVAIVLFAEFIRRYGAKSERSIWLWGLAFLSVNPLAIHFSRAIWATDILPFVGFFVFVGHWFRQRRSGAFTWGLVGMLIGQIHMSGFFWQASLVLVTAWKNRTKNRGNTKWGWWLLGTTIGVIPMLPWIAQMGTTAATIARPSWAEILTPNFPLHWLLSGWGLNLEYDLGLEFWRSFIQEPRVFGYPSFGAATALLFLAISAIASLVRWWKARSAVEIKSQVESEAKSEFVITDYFWAGGVIMPLLLLIARVRVPGHYLIVLYPFIQIWAAWLERGRGRSLILISTAQLFLSVCFLSFIHTHNGNSNWPYGLVYHLHPLQNP